MTETRKKLILHIGRHKTGTSSLQNFFAQKSELLAKRGILYPEIGRRMPHGALVTAHHVFSETLKYQSEDKIAALFEALSEESAGFDTILLSSEDFQNQKDFKSLETHFAPYDVTVVCYIREGLGYHLSGFAQRIHFSAEIFNIRQYVERQKIRMTAFIRNWERLADTAIFRLYERDKLKGRDIVEDFLDIIGLEDVKDTAVVAESNPSLSGNLLGLKMLLNLIGQAGLVPYTAFETAAGLDPAFKGKIYISDRVAEELRGLNDYNAVVKTLFPEMSEPSFEGGSRIFDLSRWDADMDLISAIPEFAFVKTLRLGALGQVLEGHGLNVDLADIDFPTPDMINAIKLPDDSQIKQIRDRAAFAAKDAMIARKARTEAEQAAIEAATEADKAVTDKLGLAKKLKIRTRKFEKDIEILTEQTKTLRQSLEDARTQSVLQMEKSDAAATASLELFNTKMESLRAERDALLAKLNMATQKSAEDMAILKTQSQKAIAARDKADAALKSKSEQMQKQAAQVFFFRAELMRFKGQVEDAKDMYKEALSRDPDNADYTARRDSLDTPEAASAIDIAVND